MNIARMLSHAAHNFPQKTALIHPPRQMRFAQLDDESSRLASALSKAGVMPGDHVGMMTPNSCQWIAAYFGILKAGAVAVTLSHNLTRSELTPILKDCRPKVIFVSDDKLPDIRSEVAADLIISDRGDISYKALVAKGDPSFPLVDRGWDDTGVILYTGGTTGTPKGVMLSHGNIMRSAGNVTRHEHSSEADTALCILPLNHVFGQVHVMVSTVFSAGGLFLQEVFHTTRMLDAISEYNITKLYAVPTVYCRLLSIPGLKKKLSGVRYCFSAGASMAREVIREWKEKTGLDMFEAYGMTETASMVTYNHYEKYVPGSVGTPVDDVEIRIVDALGHPVSRGCKGEVCISGPTVMKGYLNNEKERKSYFDGQWFRSGDIGLMDEAGYLYIIDRIKDIIITGGENVYPKDVEEILYQCHDIEECAVIGIPDKEYGERVVACIVPKPTKVINTAKLKAYLKERLSPFKVPKDFIHLKDLPKSNSGKLLKRDLKQRVMSSLLPGKRQRLPN